MARDTYVHAVAMPRKAMRDITLRDGTRVPKGAWVRVAAYPLHHDDTYLETADTFDPFRFALMRSAKGQSSKHQFTTTSLEYLGFGHGQRAWCVDLSLYVLCWLIRVSQSGKIFRRERVEDDSRVHHPQL